MQKGLTMSFFKDMFESNVATPVTIDKSHRHESFSPIREGVFVKWYVDGKNYFHAVSEALLAAEREIFIEDWWLSPELVSLNFKLLISRYHVK